MDRAPTTPHGEPPGDLERLAFFSDAVVAIALTLLVIDLRIPAGVETDAEFRVALADLSPKLFSFALSFGVIALWWSGHHRLFHDLVRFERRLLLLNLAMLLGIVFIPFVTGVLGEHGDLPTAVVLYAGTNAFVAGSLVAMRLLAERRRLLADGIDRTEFRRRTLTTAGTGLIFLVSIPVALVSPNVAIWGWSISWLILEVGVATRRRSSRA